MPENSKELFNLRHALLRNVIKRIFGVVKQKFKILGTYAEYFINTQIHLVLSLLGLYNFICLYKSVKDKDQEVNNKILKDNKVIKPLVQRLITLVINKRRDKLAKNI